MKGTKKVTLQLRAAPAGGRRRSCTACPLADAIMDRGRLSRLSALPEL